MRTSPAPRMGKRAASMAGATLTASVASLALAASAQAAPQLLAPAAETPVSGNVQFGIVKAGSVKRAAFSVDGRTRDVDVKRPFQLGNRGILNTRKLANGRHRLAVRLKLSNGRSARIARTISVSNPRGRASAADTTRPSVWWKSPLQGSTVSGLRQYSACEALAKDNVAIARVEFFVDSTRLNTEYNAPYNCVFDSRRVADGYHTLKAIAYDRAGNRAESWSKVLVKNTTTSAPAPAPSPTPTSSPTAPPAEPGKLLASAVNVAENEIYPGTTINATVTLKNIGGSPLSISDAVVTARDPQHPSGSPYYDFAPRVGARTIAVGETITIKAAYKLATTAPTGDWTKFVAWNVNGTWIDGPKDTFRVTAGVGSDNTLPPPPAPTPTPTTPPADGELGPGPTYYVDSAAGNDANSGTSPESAWRSTSKATSATLSSGSNLLFKRGGSWTGTLTIAESGVIVGAYGAGERPKFTAGTSGGCVVVSGNDNRVQDLYIDRCGVRDGIKVQGDRNVFQRNYITHNAAGAELPAGADYNKFFHNELIANNVMTKNTVGGDDDYGAYSFANEGGNYTEYGWNVIRDAKTSSYDYGVDGSALEIFHGKGVYFHHNIISGCAASIESANAVDVRIEYNVVYDGIIIPAQATRWAGPNSNVRVAYNTSAASGFLWTGGDNPAGTVTATKNLYTGTFLTGGSGVSNIDNKQVARSTLDANLKPLAGTGAVGANGVIAYGAHAPGGMDG